MSRRNKIGKSWSQKVFTKGALRKHPRNDLKSFLMRGGIRL